MKKILLSLAALALFTQGYGQAKRNCGSHEHHIQMMQSDPQYAAEHEKIDRQTEDYVANPAKHTRVVKTIPVVFHIVYNTAAQNVSDAQVQSQLAVLNADFRKLNADWSNTPAVFQGLVADCEIQFCLAQQDPNGLATTGINRVATNKTSFSTNDAVKSAAQGGANAWDRNKYLNIWVCNLSGGVLGYAQFPGGAAATDGVVITYTGFGTIGTAQAPFNKGRTATHEVGHWLNLYHIWGDDGTGCNGSDQCGDTPNQADENYGCPAFPQVSCANGPNGDMFMNFMDYTDDACMYMFTAGQKTRMDALFAPGGARVALLTSPGCNAPGGGVACGTATGLNATNVTTTTATLNWGAVANAVSYNVQYRLLNAANWTTTTAVTNSKALTGLTAGSTYQFQVQTVCNGATAPYSAIATFNTVAVGGGCTNSYEANNTRQTATLANVNTNILSMIGSNTDKDYYRITTTNAAPKLKVTLSTLPFDYDVRLYNANGTQIGISQLGGNATETIKYNANAGATYYIQVYGYNGAFSLSNCYTLNAATSNVNWRLDGNEDNQFTDKAALNIFPNPAQDKIGLQFFAVGNSAATVNIYNSLGQRILSENNTTVEGENTLSFDLANLSNGIYILELIENDERKLQKFTIQK